MQATPWGCGSAMGVSQFIDTYDPADERLADTWLMGPQFAVDGTPVVRSYDLAGKPLNFTKDLPNGLYTSEFAGYRMNKFEVKIGARDQLSNDFPFFRYSQILLMKAQCALRTGDPNTAATLVSQVCARAFKNDPQKATLTASDLLLNSKYNYGYVDNFKVTDPGDASPVEYGRLLDELGHEFAWEAFRQKKLALA
jgi:hypothetical protein